MTKLFITSSVHIELATLEKQAWHENECFAFSVRKQNIQIKGRCSLEILSQLTSEASHLLYGMVCLFYYCTTQNSANRELEFLLVENFLKPYSLVIFCFSL